jgi:hypothetical protein
VLLDQAIVEPELDPPLLSVGHRSASTTGSFVARRLGNRRRSIAAACRFGVLGVPLEAEIAQSSNRACTGRHSRPPSVITGPFRFDQVAI